MSLKASENRINELVIAGIVIATVLILFIGFMSYKNHERRHRYDEDAELKGIRHAILSWKSGDVAHGDRFVHKHYKHHT
jgi:hypothetical protein